MTPRYNKIMERKSDLSEAQNHHCAVCGVVMSVGHLGNSVKVKVDKSLTNAVGNNVVVCLPCAGRYDTDTLYELHARWIVKPWIVNKEKNYYPKHAEQVRQKFLASDWGVPPEKLLLMAVRYPPNLFDITKVQPLPKKKKRMSLWRSQKVRLFEIQRGLCCYDGYPMNTDNPSDPRYATVEHVTNVRDGGADCKNANLVIACNICNNMRDRKKVDAYTFYEWVVKNKQVIEAKAEEARKRQANKAHQRKMNQLFKKFLTDC